MLTSSHTTPFPAFGIRGLAVILIGGLLPVMGACSLDTKPVSAQNKPLSAENVQLTVRVGQTTKAQIRGHFGAPNLVARDKDGREVWTYQRNAQVSQSARQSGLFGITLFSGIGGLGGIGSASQAGASSTSRTLTLLITFDENDVVANFDNHKDDF